VEVDIVFVKLLSYFLILVINLKIKYAKNNNR